LDSQSDGRVFSRSDSDGSEGIEVVPRARQLRSAPAGALPTFAELASFFEHEREIALSKERERHREESARRRERLQMYAVTTLIALGLLSVSGLGLLFDARHVVARALWLVVQDGAPASSGSSQPQPLAPPLPPGPAPGFSRYRVRPNESVCGIARDTGLANAIVEVNQLQVIFKNGRAFVLLVPGQELWLPPSSVRATRAVFVCG